MNEYVMMWKNAFDFGGRSTVKDYWMAVLFNVIVGFVLGFVAGLIKLPILASIYSLLAIIPGLALSVRRLRDVGKSFGWLFISLVPFIGWIWLIIIMTKPSNHYGTI